MSFANSITDPSFACSGDPLFQQPNEGRLALVTTMCCDSVA
jgi:hypothetical protein